MRRIAILAMAAVLAAACDGKNFLPYSEIVDVEGDLPHGMIVLGKQLDDPYTVDNMTKALASVYPTKAGRVQLDPTDIYVRFLPTDQEQFDRLEKLCPNMLDHPLDYEIVREGDYYHDPEIPEGELTWQYAVVPVLFDFPSDIRYEVIDRCYIASDKTKGGDVDWEEVEREAYRLTGNAAMLGETRADDVSAVPSGRITIVDEGLPGEPEGVKGVMVSCNSFVKFSNAYTDEEGHYQMKRSFAGEPRYRIIFKNMKGFEIGFNLLLIPASVSTLGKGPASGVDVEVSTASERKLFCRSVVNNAGYDYYTACKQDDLSITTPPTNLRIWLFQNMNSSSAVLLQQGVVVDSSLLSDYLGEYMTLIKMFLPDITLGVKECTNFAEIYTMTTHELAHASHYMLAGKNFWNQYVRFIVRSFVTSGFVTYGVGTESDHGYCEVGEMWAYYMQTKMFRNRYDGNQTVFGTSFWFSPQILLYLDDRGMTASQIFSSLGADVCDKDTMQDKMLSLYPQFKATINQAFGRYN